jgi:hypothetical protein
MKALAERLGLLERKAKAKPKATTRAEWLAQAWPSLAAYRTEMLRVRTSNPPTVPPARITPGEAAHQACVGALMRGMEAACVVPANGDGRIDAAAVCAVLNAPFDEMSRTNPNAYALHMRVLAATEGAPTELRCP